MKRFRTYHWKGTGMIPVESIGKLEAIRGTAAHGIMERTHEGKPWEEWVAKQFEALPEKVRKVQTVLIRRAMLGYYAQRWPLLSDEYEIRSAEIAWNWVLAGDVMMPFRLDRCLANKQTGHLVIHDFKFIGSMDINWRERNANSDQTHLYVQGLKERSTVPVDGIIYDAIIVGQWDHKKEQQKSPFVSAYQRDNGSYSPTYVRGADLVDISGWPDAQWLDWAKRTGILQELYITSGLLNPASHQLLATRSATVHGEREWDLKMLRLDDALATYGAESEEYQQLFESTIERTNDACLKFGWERACEHYEACWVGGEPDNYVPREDHHKEDRKEE
jgi:hypothetical protein